MQSVSYRIWTRVAVSISNYDNDYTTGTSVIYLGYIIKEWFFYVNHFSLFIFHHSDW